MAGMSRGIIVRTNEVYKLLDIYIHFFVKRILALKENYTVLALKENYTVLALKENYTVLALKENYTVLALKGLNILAQGEALCYVYLFKI
jgi:hypothetical protein